MSLKAKRNLLILLVVLVAAAPLVIGANNYSITLRKADLHEAREVYRGLDLNNKEIRVIRAQTGDGALATALLTKKGWGVWEVTDCDISGEAQPDHAELLWTTLAGEVDMSFDEPFVKSPFRHHYLLLGNNAFDLICFEDGQLPDNAMVDFSQNLYNGDYWVYITWCDLPGADGDHALGFYQALVDNGCIQPQS